MEETQVKTKFCKFCGSKIPEDAVMCTHCGRQVEQLKSEQSNVVINNTNTNVNRNIGRYGGAKKQMGCIATMHILRIFRCPQILRR